MSLGKLLPAITRFYFWIGIVLMVGAIVLLLIPLVPEIYYVVNSNASFEEVEALSAPLSDIAVPSDHKARIASLPPVDLSLPKENRLVIPSISLNGHLNEGDNADKALRKGLWRVNNFGIPEVPTLPIIIAAHRFGYSTWSREFRQHNSFYELPKTKVGDRIEIIWNQRKYVYEITRATEGTFIDDYSEDLILYTCKFIKSPERIFRYAKRIE